MYVGIRESPSVYLGVRRCTFVPVRVGRLVRSCIIERVEELVAIVREPLFRLAENIGNLFPNKTSDISQPERGADALVLDAVKKLSDLALLSVEVFPEALDLFLHADDLRGEIARLVLNTCRVRHTSKDLRARIGAHTQSVKHILRALDARPQSK